MLGFAEDPYSLKAHSLRLYPTQKHNTLFTPKNLLLIQTIDEVVGRDR
jgi:hypothetical protein